MSEEARMDERVEEIREVANNEVALAFERDWHNFYPSWLEEEYGYEAIEEIENYPAFLRTLLDRLQAAEERVEEAAEILRHVDCECDSYNGHECRRCQWLQSSAARKALGLDTREANDEEA